MGQAKGLILGVWSGGDVVVGMENAGQGGCGKVFGAVS